MKDQKPTLKYYQRTLYRCITAVFGLFLTGVGLYATILGAPEPWLRVVVGLAIALAGVNMLWAAAQAQESWVCKLGPIF